MKPIRSDAVILVVSQPVDVLTTLAQELSGLPSSQVLGSGTFLDSLRLGRLLAGRLKVRTVNILQYIQSLDNMYCRLRQLQ
jgi:L-lactate dehydrogenase